MKRRVEEDDEIYIWNKVLKNIGQCYPNRAYKRNSDNEDKIITTNKRQRKNDELNHLPVKRSGNNFGNNREKRQILSEFYGEVSKHIKH